MAIKYLAGDRLIGTAAERTALTVGSQGANTSWKQLGRSTVTSGTATNMTTSTFTPKDNYVVLCDSIMSSDDQTIFHFGYNNITDNQSGQYTRRMSTNGASASASSGQAGAWNTVDSSDNEREFSVTHIRDDGGTDSYVNARCRGMDLGGATDSIGNVTESKAVWNYDSNRINILGTKVYGNDSVLAAGSEFIVLGMNDNEADSGTNFWQELASTTLDATATSISSGTFTAKRWLWVQFFRVPDGGQYADYIRFNDDSGSGNYHYKINDNRGSSYSNSSSDTGILTNETSQPTQYGHGTYWISNPSTAHCKGLIGEDIRSGDADMDSDTVNMVQEVYGKWENTADQITKITMHEGGSGAGYAAGTMMKVWGSDGV